MPAGYRDDAHSWCIEPCPGRRAGACRARLDPPWCLGTEIVYGMARVAVETARDGVPAVTKKVLTTRIADNGLRYESKKAGTPFTPTSFNAEASMSCFFCGKHCLPAERKRQKVLMRHETVCDPTCEKNPKFKAEQRAAAAAAGPDA